MRLWSASRLSGSAVLLQGREDRLAFFNEPLLLDAAVGLVMDLVFVPFVLHPSVVPLGCLIQQWFQETNYLTGDLRETLRSVMDLPLV